MKTKGDKEEKLNKDLKKADLAKEKPDKEDVAKGIEEESKEHPEFDKKIIAQLVDDHLKIDEDYYEKE